MRHAPLIAVGLVLVSGAAWAQPSSNAPPPPPQTSAQTNQTELDCRRQAASQTGYNRSNSSDSNAEHRYADAYYACMDDAYGPPSPDYAYAPPPPAPYYYGPYPYPYYYPPYYYGPGVSFGFRFGGGFHGGRHR